MLGMGLILIDMAFYTNPLVQTMESEQQAMTKLLFKQIAILGICFHYIAPENENEKGRRDGSQALNDSLCKCTFI